MNALLPPILPHALIAAEPSFRPRPVEDVVEAARALGVPQVTSARDVPAAARQALEMARGLGDAIVVVTGSFYMVGDLPPQVWASLLASLPVYNATR